MRTITSVLGNSQRLDGGALFGNAPKALWRRWHVPDEDNRIATACRCLLVQEEGRRVLFETGIGAFFEPKLQERFGVTSPEHDLIKHLARLGVAPEDVDVIVLSHLHFDHAGGLLHAFVPGQPPSLASPNATFLVSEKNWERARTPHPRDRASFIPSMVDLLAQSGRLEILRGETTATLGEGYRFHYSDGHTPGMMLTEIAMSDGPVIYGADLVPGVAWLPAAITMGYDRYPELLIDEKSALLGDLVSRKGRLFYCHDPDVAVSFVDRDERGRFCAIDGQADTYETSK